MPGDQDLPNSQSDSSQSRSSVGYRSRQGTSNISSKTSSNPRRGQQLCKYKLLEDCPFGDRCRFRHSSSKQLQPAAVEHDLAVSDTTVGYRGGVGIGTHLVKESASSEGPYSSIRDESTSGRPSGGKHRQVCRYFLKSSCKYGDKCKFFHPKRPDNRPGVFDATAEKVLAGEEPLVFHRSASPCDSDSGSKPLLDTVAYPSLQTQGRRDQKTHRNPSDGVSELPVKHSPATRGREPTELSLGDFILKREPQKQLHQQKALQSTSLELSTTRASQPQSRKGKIVSDLREVELQKLEAMFPDCQLVEKSRQHSVYRVSLTPSNPQWSDLCRMWGFKGKLTVPLLITIPAAYPSEVLGVVIPDDQGLTPAFVAHGNCRLQSYLQEEARAFKDTLMLRSVIYWIEDNIIAIFTEAFEQSEDSPDGDNDSGDDVSSEDGTGSESGESGSGGSENEEGSGRGEGGEGGGVLPAKRGTEVRLVGVRLSEGVATVQCTALRLVLACSRCKMQHDVTARAESRVSESCTRCHSCFTVLYHPSLLHAASTTLGFMDLLGCTIHDVVLLRCELVVVCLECGRESSTQGLSYGQLKDSWCRRCHTKLTLFAEQFKLVQHQPGSLVPEVSDIPTRKKVKKRSPLIKEGEPLPELGTCVHYKKSHRWLRFPCCGKAYPCDVCHDSTEEHAMERATRMLCGFCAKEQPYTGTKPCVLCGSDLTNIKKSIHWEGGLGCRNKTKMSRNDKHKYSGSAQKTACKRLERVGEKPKAK